MVDTEEVATVDTEDPTDTERSTEQAELPMVARVDSLAPQIRLTLAGRSTFI